MTVITHNFEKYALGLRAFCSNSIGMWTALERVKTDKNKNTSLYYEDSIVRYVQYHAIKLNEITVYLLVTIPTSLCCVLVMTMTAP